MGPTDRCAWEEHVRILQPRRSWRPLPVDMPPCSHRDNWLWAPGEYWASRAGWKTRPLGVAAGGLDELIPRSPDLGALLRGLDLSRPLIADRAVGERSTAGAGTPCTKWTCGPAPRAVRRMRCERRIDNQRNGPTMFEVWEVQYAALLRM